ncbi:hypothetical protein [Paenibacillus sp. NPDC058071]
MQAYVRVHTTFSLIAKWNRLFDLDDLLVVFVITTDGLIGNNGQNGR